MTLYYASNDAATGFDALATGALPAGWTAKTGTWQIGTTQTSLGHSHSFGSTTKGDGDVALLTGIAAMADMDLLYAQKLVSWGSAGPLIAPVLRADAANANHYTVVAQGSGAQGGGTAAVPLIFKKVNGAYALLSSTGQLGGAAGSAAWVNGDIMWIRAQAQGSTIRVRAWKDGASEPSGWDAAVTDSAISAPGIPGLYYSANGAALPAMAITEMQVASIGSETPALTIATPAASAAGASLTITGTYTGAPLALDYQIDAGTWTAVPTPTISGGTYSFTITAPAAGSHTIGVRDRALTGTAVMSGSFSTTSGAALTIATPGPVPAGKSMILSGTYTGTAPPSLNYAFDGGTYRPGFGATISGGTWSLTVTAPALGTHTVSIQNANTPALTATSDSFAALLAPDDAALLYTPYTWTVQPAAAATANPGAGLRTLFTGSTCILNFDVTTMVSPASQIWWRIDNGPWTQATLAATIACTVPPITAGNADVPYHLLEVVVKSMTETQNRWNPGASTRVIFTGLALAAGAAVAPPLAAPLSLLIYGDSITEGVRTLGEAAANDTDRNDSSLGWAHRLGGLLGAETGIVGFGAQGLSTGGSGNVPPLGAAWNLLYANTPRSFTPMPDLIILNIGTNDGTANTIAAMTSLLDALIQTCPTTPIAILRPFNGNQAANLQTAIAACANPTRCHYTATAEFFSPAYGADTIALHPAGPNNTARIAPQIATALRPLLAGTTTTPWFRPGFRQGLV